MCNNENYLDVVSLSLQEITREKAIVMLKLWEDHKFKQTPRIYIAMTVN
jgi:hypothetical protein